MAFVRTVRLAHGDRWPGPANNRLLIYNSSSSGAVGCRGLDIIEVPLDDPSAATYLRFEPSGDPRPPLPNLVTIDAVVRRGDLLSQRRRVRPAPDEAGIAGDIVLVNDGSALPTEGWPTRRIPRRAIALVDRGTCGFVRRLAMRKRLGQRP